MNESTVSTRWSPTRVLQPVLLVGIILAGITRLGAQEVERRGESSPLAAGVVDTLSRPAFGFGITAGARSLAGELLGGHLLYAPSRRVQIGLQVGLATQSAGQNGGNSFTEYLLTPFTKVFFETIGDFSPFIIGGLTIAGGSSSYQVDDEYGYSYNSSSTSVSLGIGAGGEYFATEKIGLFGYVGLIDYDFDTGTRRIGVLGPRVGIEWMLP